MAEEKENNLSDNPSPEGDDVTPAGGEGNDSDPVGKAVKQSEDVGIADVLNEALGRKYSSDEEALKSVKETYGYVGKVGKVLPLIDSLQGKGMKESQIIGVLEGLMTEDNPTGEQTPSTEQPKQEVDPSKFVSRDEFEESTFYAQKPELAPYKGVIKALKSQNPDKSLAEVVELDDFKTVYEKAHAYEEAEKSKSVLQSNPRLGQVTDKISQARDAQGKGDDRAAGDAAVGAVLDAFENQ